MTDTRQKLGLWAVAMIFIYAMLWWSIDRPLHTLALFGVSAALVAAVVMSVHQAEVIAHRVGEPFGTLVLAVAVTVIEVALIVSLMVGEGRSAHALARDTVFAAVMIVCNGIVGICLVVGAMRHHVVDFRVAATTPALTVLVALATLTLVLPRFTVTTTGPTFSSSQLIFAAIISLTLYGAFVFVQTVRHREDFSAQHSDSIAHQPNTASTPAWLSALLLPMCLIPVVALAKSLSPAIADTVANLGAPASLLGVIFALLVLLPETGAAVRAAARNQMQTSLNLALGSALATIGLTIPTVAAVCLILDLPLTLGLPDKELVMLVLTFIVSTLTLSSGRATVLQGLVHLALFAVFLFLAVVP